MVKKLVLSHFLVYDHIPEANSVCRALFASAILVKITLITAESILTAQPSLTRVSRKIYDHGDTNRQN